MNNFPKGKFNIIYCDPAWKYDSGFLKRNWSNKYPTMKPEDIYNLPVDKIADENCVLFIWITYPKLLIGLEAIKRWGFTYKSCAFTWVKRNKKADSYFWGMGHWTRANSECCFIAVKGKPKRFSKSVHQIVDSKIQHHSKKPDCVRDRIVELCGDLPRIELFARNKTKGWTVWGNEVNE
jgi:N6-adenosine-specific RNA methylase IME4